MISLNDILTVKQQIDAADFTMIKKLVKLLFNIRPDRTSRQRVRKFTGFEFEQESDETKNRRKFLEEADDEDVEKFAEILNIEKSNILDSLFNLQELKSALGNEASSSEEESSEEEKETQEERRTKPNKRKSQNTVYSPKPTTYLSSQVSCFFPFRFRGGGGASPPFGYATAYCRTRLLGTLTIILKRSMRSFSSSSVSPLFRF